MAGPPGSATHPSGGPWGLLCSAGKSGPVIEPDGPDRQRPQHYTAFAGMCLIWGSTFLVIRIGDESIAPEWGATLRLVIAAALLLLLARATGARLPRGRALLGAALYGFLTLGLNFALLYWGERTVPSGIAAVLYATMPISSGIFAAALGVQRLSAVRMVAAAIGLSGVALIFAGELRIGAPALALVGVSCGATLAALSGVILKRLPASSPLATNAVGALIGAAVCFGASVLMGENRHLPRTFGGWGPILYLAVLGNLGAFVLYTWLLSQWRVTSVNMGSLIVPVLAVILGAAVKGESLHPSSYAGAALVLTGVAVSLRVGRDASPPGRRME